MVANPEYVRDIFGVKYGLTTDNMTRPKNEAKT